MASPTITDFIGKVSNVARSNLFEVLFDGGPFTANEDTKYLCKAASIPGKQIGQIQVKYQNNTVNYPGDLTYPELSLTFINDDKFSLRKTLEDWCEAIKTKDKTESTAWTSWSDGKISLFPKSGKDFSDLAEYEFFHCFPSDLGTIDLGWDNSDSAQEYTVTFTYSYWQKTK